MKKIYCTHLVYMYQLQPLTLKKTRSRQLKQEKYDAAKSSNYYDTL